MNNSVLGVAPLLSLPHHSESTTNLWCACQLQVFGCAHAGGLERILVVCGRVADGNRTSGTEIEGCVSKDDGQDPTAMERNNLGLSGKEVFNSAKE